MATTTETDDDEGLSESDRTKVEELQDRACLEAQVRHDGAAILLMLGRIARREKDPRVKVAAAREYRVWADGLLGRKTAEE